MSDRFRVLTYGVAALHIVCGLCGAEVKIEPHLAGYWCQSHLAPGVCHVEYGPVRAPLAQPDPEGAD